MNKETENVSTISSRDRILRLLARMCKAQMNVIMRTANSPAGISIRGVFKDGGEDAGDMITIGDISSKGIMRLLHIKEVQIEVLGMPSRVTFESKVLKIGKSELQLQVPKQLISVERRQNSRYPTTVDHMAYFALEKFQNSETSLANPPIFGLAGHMDSWISIADLSVTGACLFTRFKGVYDHIEVAGDLLLGKLIFPMMDPAPLAVSIRWKKRTVQSYVEEDVEKQKLEFRIGIEFNAMTEDKTTRIRQFMRRLSMAQAI